jgi:hypothetical protein
LTQTRRVSHPLTELSTLPSLLEIFKDRKSQLYVGYYFPWSLRCRNIVLHVFQFDVPMFTTDSGLSLSEKQVQLMFSSGGPQIPIRPAVKVRRTFRSIFIFKSRTCVCIQTASRSCPDSIDGQLATSHSGCSFSNEINLD